MNRYYAVLGLSPGASKDEVRRKYRKLVLQWHPDKNPSPEAHAKFIAITEAYDILMGEHVSTRAKANYTRTNYSKATYTAQAKTKSREEQMREKRAQRHEMLKQKFENIRQQHLRAPDFHQRKEGYYMKVGRYFAMAALVFAAAIVLPLTIIEPGNLIWSIPVGLGLGLRWFWTGGRIKMRADMIYSGRTDYTMEDIAEFFRTRSGFMNTSSDVGGE